jgi:hypothetical protein
LQSLRAIQNAPTNFAGLVSQYLEGRKDVLFGFERVQTNVVISLDGLHDGCFAQAQDLRIWIGGEHTDDAIRHVRQCADRIGIKSSIDRLAVRRIDLRPFTRSTGSLPVCLLGPAVLKPLDSKTALSGNSET